MPSSPPAPACGPHQPTRPLAAARGFMYLNAADLKMLADRAGTVGAELRGFALVAKIIEVLDPPGHSAATFGQLCWYHGSFGLVNDDREAIEMLSTGGVRISMSKANCGSEIACGGPVSHFYLQTRHGRLAMDVLGTSGGPTYIKPHAVVITDSYWADRFNTLGGTMVCAGDGASPRAETRPPATVFISYSHADETHRRNLDKALTVLRRQGMVSLWSDRTIEVGDDWKGMIDSRLEEADVIILLVSSDFVASDYCWDEEMTRAMERHAAGTARVIPIFIRDCDWTGAPFAKLQGVPDPQRPVTSWPNQDEAWAVVAKAIRHAISR